MFQFAYVREEKKSVDFQGHLNYYTPYLIYKKVRLR